MDNVVYADVVGAFDADAAWCLVVFVVSSSCLFVVVYRSCYFAYFAVVLVVYDDDSFVECHGWRLPVATSCSCVARLFVQSTSIL